MRNVQPEIRPDGSEGSTLSGDAKNDFCKPTLANLNKTLNNASTEPKEPKPGPSTASGSCKSEIAETNQRS